MFSTSLISNPFESDEETMVVKGETKLICINNEVSQAIQKKTYALAANGKYFKLPEGSAIRSLVYEDNSILYPAPVGSIASFIDSKGVKYNIWYDSSSKQFIGYKTSAAENDIIKEYTNDKKGESAALQINKSACKITVDGVSFSLTPEVCDCTEPASASGSALQLKEYLVRRLDSKYTSGINQTVSFAQSMGEKYDDYIKIALAKTDKYRHITSEETLKAYLISLQHYSEQHKNAIKVDNPNCPDCPKYPINGDCYWDEKGRNWVYSDNKWKDLSGEFCSETGCNNSWKNGIDVQSVHQQFYDYKLDIYHNYPGQEINDEFKASLWRATQFATVHVLKEQWVADQVGDSWWNLLFGNLKSSYYKFQVANGDMTFYTGATLDGAFAAADILFIESVAKNLVWKVGIKYLVIDGGAKYLGQKAYYTVGKQLVTLRLSYKLSSATPEAAVFFEKQLSPCLEIFDLSTGRYIKYNPSTGEMLVGKTVESGEREIIYEGFGKVTASQGLSTEEQARFALGKVEEVLQKAGGKFDELLTNLKNNALLQEHIFKGE